jgi:2-aminoadipate transaminase
VPECIDTKEFLVKALEKKVAFVPGVDFFPYADGGHNAMRLNFSTPNPNKIVEGIHRRAAPKELAHTLDGAGHPEQRAL